MSEVRESKRADEARLQQETEDGLKHFREAQLEREKERREREERERENEQGLEAESEDWNVGRKRKRDAKGFVKGVKRRASDVSGGSPEELPERKSSVDATKRSPEKEKTTASVGGKPRAGLVDYGSDDDDDDDD